MKRLENKVALITGAAKGMGKAEAQLFAQEGAKLIISDIDLENLTILEKELSAAGTQVIAIKHDVSSELDWAAVAKQAENAFGKVDILINNAGILGPDGIEATSLENWNKIIGVNQTGTWLGMKHIIPLMRKAGGGSIVNISSIYGLIGSGTSAAYQASKGAVRILSKTAAVEYAAEQIRVNTIFPGAIATPMVSEALTEEDLQGLLSAVPMKRIGKPIEVAYGALFLASIESSYITGAELVIDGGWTIP
ncbi:MAG: glucose 1-dehydrogenase [Candidatus Cloacimonetes bacterium]|jgi:NAD(P)-dependent dehydrogenase (short-subunit alcohol dehydrogenase family)|nr:glucose 1-dehydrogenase [Candidatus Cloacimonadota bacterium]MCB5286823.1 glucose 1-dehydrogenase [Candidatus Cloacimonadota bacterium]MCK9184171.1 glucose 1-dehydrogenase [Candidatus Cloacimonadota bacterium]MCK9584183.1 glucose 1-dehydrogenase [Candidatus Cloacimonadota bacterium]MDY0229145.1 glucose 1-dehydrogenase [Candidatus Cloacimonadaceae bacterium]